MPAPYTDAVYAKIREFLAAHRLLPADDALEHATPPANPNRGPAVPNDIPRILHPDVESPENEGRPRAELRAIARTLQGWVEDHAEWWVAARAWHEVSTEVNGTGPR